MTLNVTLSSLGKVGLAVETSWAIPKTSRDPGDWAAQDRAFAFDFDWFTDPVFRGDYPDVMKKEVMLRSRIQNLTVSRLPVFTKEERTMIRGNDLTSLTYLEFPSATVCLHFLIP